MRRSIRLASMILGLGLTTAAVTARAEWYQATSKHFIVFAEGNAETVKERAEELELFDGVFRYFQNVEARPEDESNKVTLYVVPNDSAVRRLYGSNSANICLLYTSPSPRD